MSLEKASHLPPRKGEWRSELPATLEAIERFCGEFKLWHAQTCVTPDLFSAELLLREALTNSVIHGCGQDPRKRVSCILRAKRDRLVIAIQDTGAGFDWRAVWDRRSEVSGIHGRGIEILRHYASAIRFNPKGNFVMLVKQF
jgi:anti-sigma regulatory factor (Ser/Thr protein kinase)